MKRGSVKYNYEYDASACMTKEVRVDGSDSPEDHTTYATVTHTNAYQKADAPTTPPRYKRGIIEGGNSMDDNDDSGMDDDGDDDGDVPGDDNAMDEENGLGDDDDDNSSSTGDRHGGVQYGSITFPPGVKRYGMVEVERLSDLVDSAVAHARSCGGELTTNNKTDSVVAEVALSCSCGHNYDWCGSGAGEGSIPNVLNLACLSTPDVELTAMNNLFRAMGAGRVSSAHAGVKAGAAMERAVNGVDRELELETLAAVKASPHSTQLLVDGAASIGPNPREGGAPTAPPPSLYEITSWSCSPLERYYAYSYRVLAFREYIGL